MVSSKILSPHPSNVPSDKLRSPNDEGLLLTHVVLAVSFGGSSLLHTRPGRLKSRDRTGSSVNESPSNTIRKTYTDSVNGHKSYL